MKARYLLLIINQLSKTIIQSCLASLIWPLGYCPLVDEYLLNMTTLVLICRYSDMSKLMPTTESGCIYVLSFPLQMWRILYFFLAKQANAAVAIALYSEFNVLSLILNYQVEKFLSEMRDRQKLFCNNNGSDIVAVTNKGLLIRGVQYTNKHWISNWHVTEYWVTIVTQ